MPASPPPTTSPPSLKPIPTASPTPHPPPPPTPAEAKKIATLEAKLTTLRAQIAATEAELKETEARLQTKDPRAVVKRHIGLLHDYNEIRDIGQGLMGLVAEKRGCRVGDVMGGFGVGEGD